MLFKTEDLLNLTKYFLMESLLNKILSPHKYNCSSKDIITGVFLWMYLSKNIFSLLDFTENVRISLILRMRSRMFYKIDVLENSAKFTDNHPHQNILAPAQRFSWEFFENFRNFFYGTPLSDCFLFQFNLLTVLKHFCFRTNQYSFNIPAFPGYIKIPVPRSLVTFFT